MTLTRTPDVNSANGLTNEDSQSIAIIGISCRFPGGASSPSKLWELVAAGDDGWSPIPDRRFNGGSLYDPDTQRTDRASSPFAASSLGHHVEGGYFLDEDIDLFDSAFFNLTSDAAHAMDPQLRMLLEASYEALDDAGIPLSSLAKSNTSVFTGLFERDYSSLLLKDPEALPPAHMTGNGAAMFSNRLSYFYDLRGPSMTLDTGCSGSMTALHLGCQGLQNGDSDLSIVAGTTLHLNPDTFLSFSNLGLLGRDGRCHSLDHRFGGYGRGEGTAVLILKSLSSAIRDGDHVHAVIRQSAINQDGRTNTITSPSMEAQRDLILQCYQQAGLNPAETPYVEAHLTGTGGDAIEANAIAEAFGKPRLPGDAVYLGAIKPNIGHTEAASGLASVIKATLVLQNRLIPPVAQFEQANPNIPLTEWNLQLATSLVPWPKGAPLRASVNNFGYGGTNVHLILDAAPERARQNHLPLINGTNKHDTSHKSGSLIYMVTAKDAQSAAAMRTNLAIHLRKATERSDQPSMTDVAYTLSHRKSRFNWMTAVRASSLSDLVTKLEQTSRKAIRASTSTPKIGFVFNGQGAQWYAMGRELMETYPVFASALRQADTILRQTYSASWSLYDEFLRDETTTRVHETALGQPMTVALQLCLVVLLQSWGIVPTAVVSHSSGEIAAAYAAGILSFSEALGVVYHRGRLAEKHQQRSSMQGSMLAAALSAEEAQAYVDETGRDKGTAVVACINSPGSVTLAGDSTAIEDIQERLEEDGVFARRLKVPMAYHSHHMQGMAQEYEACLKTMLPPVPPPSKVVFASPVTGSVVASSKALTPEHWVRNLTNPVLFSSALESMHSHVDIVLEVGAHDTLSGPIRQTIPKESNLTYLSCLKRSVNAVHTMQDVACDLLSRGYPVLVEEVNQLSSVDPPPRFCPGLPSYAWNHSTRFGLEPRASKEHRHKRFPPQELLGTPVPGCNRRNPTWRNFLRVQNVPWLVDHQLQSQVVLPGAAYVSMAIEAMHLLTRETRPSDTIAGYMVRDVEIVNALSVPSGSASASSLEGIETNFSLKEASERDLDHDGWYDFELWSVTTDSAWIKHGAGKIKAAVERDGNIELLQDLRGQVTHVEASQIEERLRQSEFEFGPAFCNLSESRVSGDRAITNFTMSATAFAERPYILHPTTLDSVFQSCYTLLPPEVTNGSMCLPRSVGQMFVPFGLGARDSIMQTGAQILAVGPRETVFRGSVAVKGVGQPVLQFKDFRMQRIKRETAWKDAHPPHAKLVWEPDVLHDMPARMKRDMEIWLADAELDFEQRIRQASYLLMVEALQKLHGEEEVAAWQWHHQKLYRWMQEVVSGDPDSDRASWTKLSNERREQLLEQLADEGVVGRLTCRVGKHLAEIIRGQVMPLELMMDDDLLHQYYRELPQLKHRSSKHLRRIIELWAVKNPGARVLEIGAGTGGATQHVLDGFAAKSLEIHNEAGHPSLLQQYDFTDISAGFFPAARERFAAWQRTMNFATLDIERAPDQQGFVTGSYDLIVAAQVLHATKNLRRTLSHVRQLLRPGGKLILLESTQHALDAQMIFGCLPGWWLSEEPERQMSPNVDQKTWNAALRDSGFSGLDFDIGDCEQRHGQIWSTLVATAVSPASYPRSLTIVHDHRTGPAPWANSLVDALEAITGARATLAALEEAAVALHSDAIIALLDITDLDAATFRDLKTCLLKTPDVLLLGRGDAHAAQSVGLLRTLRREDPTKRYVYLDLRDHGDADAIHHIIHVFRTSFANYPQGSGAVCDWEYAIHDSILHVPRLYPDIARDRYVAHQKAPPQLGSYHDCEQNLVWGGAEQSCFVEAPLPCEDEIGPRIEVRAKAFGLSAIDTSSRSNPIWHATSGVITRIGHEAAQHTDLRVGDRVCGMLQGRFASTSRTPWTHLVRVPENVSWEQAASVPNAFVTAYIALHHIARIQAHEHVLVLAAGSDVGQAAVRLAQQNDAMVFATCTTSEEQQLLKDRFGIPLDRISTTEHSSSFAETIVRQTGGHGIDIAMGYFARGSTLKVTWQSMAKLGRFVYLGGSGPHFDTDLDMGPFAGGATMTCLDLHQFCESRGQVIREALLHSVKLLTRTHSIEPPVTVPLSDLGPALRQVQMESPTARMVAVPQENETVLVQRADHRPKLSLSKQDACYMIVGGLGGIGFEIASWMVRSGAKHLLVVSRGATSHPRLKVLREAAGAHECTIYARDCDISAEENIADLARSLNSDGIPHVQGVIQAAAVLDDSVLERMTHEQWVRAASPKITGTYALHRHFRNLDFFIMLSSATGVVGNVSQSNYTAGNTFQDALARHRTAIGLPALSIDLGPVGNVGWIAERGEAMRRRVEQNLGMKSMSVAHVLRLIESGITDPLQRRPADSQIVCCMGTYDGLVDDPVVRSDPRLGTLRLGNGVAADDVQQSSDAVATSRLDELVREVCRVRDEEPCDVQKDEAEKVMTALMVAKIAELFNVDEEQINIDQSLLQHGVDSLVAVGLRSWLGVVLKARVSIFEILQTPALKDFARLLVERGDLVQRAANGVLD